MLIRWKYKAQSGNVNIELLSLDKSRDEDNFLWQIWSIFCFLSHYSILELAHIGRLESDTWRTSWFTYVFVSYTILEDESVDGLW